MGKATPNNDFRPTAAWERLRLRAALLRRLREFFDARGFLEVETPILSADTVVDRHLDPFWTKAEGGGRRAEEDNAKCKLPETSPQPLAPSPSSRLWLQTSPEFAMKRMLAAGAGPIYQVARVFRQDELGPLHNPEFTLVEWYQPGEDLDAGMTLTADLCEALLSSFCCGKATNRNGMRACTHAILPENSPCVRASTHPTDIPPLAERITYAEAFERWVGIDPHTADGAALKEIAKKLGVAAPESLSQEDRDGWLDLLLVECIQPHLGQDRPALLYDYPASQAALARVRHEQGKPPVAERFELYIHGIEIANGYHELLDPAELRARNAEANRLRLADGKQPLPEESQLLSAMDAGLPPSVGVALGFDRLAMIALGAKTIAEVMAFPFDRA